MKGMHNYKFESCTETFFSLAKKGMNPITVQLNEMPLDHKLSTEKKSCKEATGERVWGESKTVFLY